MVEVALQPPVPGATHVAPHTAAPLPAAPHAALPVLAHVVVVFPSPQPGRHTAALWEQLVDVRSLVGSLCAQLRAWCLLGGSTTAHHERTASSLRVSARGTTATGCA